MSPRLEAILATRPRGTLAEAEDLAWFLLMQVLFGEITLEELAA